MSQNTHTFTPGLTDVNVGGNFQRERPVIFSSLTG